MLNLPKAKKHLVPLRRFSCDGLYTLAYLSQLVQRGKLKAKKVGKNYHTNREWFENYLEAHALDNTREAYNELFRQADQLQVITNRQIAQGKYKPAAIPGQITFLNRLLVKRIMISVMVLFVLGISITGLITWLGNRQGQISGVEEVNKENISTSTNIIETK